LLLAIALAATASGLARVTSPRAVAEVPRPTVKPPVATPGVPFRLLLSAPAAEVEIEGSTVVRPPVIDSPISGTVEIDPRNPRVALIVRWKSPATTGEHRFAKLTLEAPGQETFTHVFDADGNIDDILELPIPGVK
jgi:hypothetical protein